MSKPISNEVTVEYFAAARELCGLSHERVVLEHATMHAHEFLALLAARHAALSPLVHRMRLAINGELVMADAQVAAGDEVAVLPPVAGGSEARPRAIRSTPLSVDEVLSLLRAPDIGGIALFIGSVRDHAKGRHVVRLDYEAHPLLAEREITDILDALEREHQAERVRLVAVHRVGELAVGELAVIVGASSPHRAAAFAACRAAIEQIKERVPIWKKEWFSEGDASWVNLDS